MTTELNHLQKVLDEQPYPLLFASLSGAHLYGFPSPDSDYDVRGAYVLPLDDIIGLTAPRETVSQNTTVDGVEVDLVTHDVKNFMLLALKKNGNMVEQIYSPHVLYATSYLEDLREIMPRCITRFIGFHYLGFSKRKWEEFEKQPQKQVKTLLYVYRTLLTGLHLLQTHEVEPNLNHLWERFGLTFIPDLIAAKVESTETAYLPAPDVDFHQGQYQRLHAELEANIETSTLPKDQPGQPEMNRLLIEIRREMGQG